MGLCNCTQGIFQGKLAVADSAATIIINDKREVLILQRGQTAPWMPLKWGLPGGGIDAGETAEAAAIRETQEEVDLTPQDISHFSDMEYEKGHLVSFFTAVRYTGTLRLAPDPKLGFPEHSEFAWITKDQLGSYEFVPTVEKVLRQAFDRIQ
eukprot:TRINITY_DN24356_c0_g1_i1.p1 TRINITY_DN24356_c0_g1~~TRINITY_DN24356_c0_g1_i1.p1  ORF type:complete len:152 (+),score=22.23 TRINITY_DN24356_c0_g1_i1:75-530(+)